MKEAMSQMARYNVWANGRVITAMQAMDATAPDAEVASSFPSLRKTVAHLRAAEQIWLERLQLVERPVWRGEEGLQESFPALCAAWSRASDALADFAEKQYNDKALQHVVEYRDLKGVLHKTPVFAVLQHIFNHSTYHRGQLTTMMRALGEVKIPQMDYILFVRSGGK